MITWSFCTRAAPTPFRPPDRLHIHNIFKEKATFKYQVDGTNDVKNSLGMSAISYHKYVNAKGSHIELVGRSDEREGWRGRQVRQAKRPWPDLCPSCTVYQQPCAISASYHFIIAGLFFLSEQLRQTSLYPLDPVSYLIFLLRSETWLMILHALLLILFYKNKTFVSINNISQLG